MPGFGFGIRPIARRHALGSMAIMVPANTLAPAVSGGGAVGSTLSVSNGGWSNSPISYAYQWRRDGANISGAITMTYVVVSADAGHNITCRVTATNAGGSASSTSNALTIPAAPTNTVAPAISGTTQDGSTLTCSNGTWTGSPTFTYQWLRDGVPVSGSTASTRTLTSADVGHVMACTVTASNAGGSASATSNSSASVIAVVPTNTAAPVASGATSLGSLLSSTSGTWTNNPGYAYQWRRDGVDIAGATAATYTLVSADASRVLTCRVTASNTGGSASAVSNAITADAPVVAPTLTAPAGAAADPRVGLAATGTAATFSGATSIVHEVYTIAGDGTATLAAAGSSYTPVVADFTNNRLLEFRSTATNSGGSTVSRAYAPITAMFDSMTGSDGTLVTAHTGENGQTWTRNTLTTTYNSNAQIVGNRIGTSEASKSLNVWAFEPPSAAYAIEATYTTGNPVGTSGMITFRSSKSAGTFYGFYASGTAWTLFKNVAGTSRSTDLVGVGSYALAPFGGRTYSTSSTGLSPAAVRVLTATDYQVVIHVWDEGGAVQIAAYVNGVIVARVTDTGTLAAAITAGGTVGWYDNQAAIATATGNNKASNFKVHFGRNPNTARIDNTPMQAITNAGSLDLRGAAKAYASADSTNYTRAVGGWCEGGTSDIKVRVEKAVGADTVVDWVTPTGLTIAGPRWFGTLSLPRSAATTNSVGSAWDVLRYRVYRGSTIVRTGSSARFGSGIALTCIGSSIAGVFAYGDDGPTTMATAGLTPNANSAVLLCSATGRYFYNAAADSVTSERASPDNALHGWRIGYGGAVGANVYLDRVQQEFGGLAFVVAGGVGGTSIGPTPNATGWFEGVTNGHQFDLWSAQLAAMGGVNAITEDFGINEGQDQTANSGVLTRADMLSRWNTLHAAVRGIAGHASVPIIVKGTPSRSVTTGASASNGPGNNRRARQAEVDAVAYDSAVYRGPPQFDIRRADGLHPDRATSDGTALVGARVAEEVIALLKGTTVPRLSVTAAKVSNTQTRFSVSGVVDALTTRTGLPDWEIATGTDLDSGVLAVSASVYEGTTAGVATYLVTHASTGGSAYRAGYGEAPLQGTSNLGTSDTVSLRDTRTTYPRAFQQTVGGISL